MSRARSAADRLQFAVGLHHAMRGPGTVMAFSLRAATGVEPTLDDLKLVDTRALAHRTGHLGWDLAFGCHSKVAAHRKRLVATRLHEIPALHVVCHTVVACKDLHQKPASGGGTDPLCASLHPPAPCGFVDCSDEGIAQGFGHR